MSLPTKDRPEVVIYTTRSCAYCQAAKSLLRGKGIDVREMDITGDDDQRDELVRRTGQRTVPQIFIGTRHVGGFEDLSALDQRGELDPLLGLGA